MRALILAAGYGERLRPLTDTCPKPLIEIGGRTLLERHLEALAGAGFSEVVVNTAHLADEIREFVGDGGRWGLSVQCSHEPDGPLETGGGMLRALPLLGPGPFLAVNADILTDYPFASLRDRDPEAAHLVLVDNPDWRDQGDFELCDGVVTGRGPASLTFAGIGVYRPELVAGQPPGRFSVVPLLEAAMSRGQVSGEHYRGDWQDIGTPERLAEARSRA